MVQNLSDHQLNRLLQAEGMLYTNLMVTTHQKALAGMQRIKRKEAKCFIKEKQQTMKENDQRETAKTATKQVTKWE